ncbi:hypothetical protein ACKFR5_02965 [Corynebacterium marquesiae]|uniref:hypothetical protein n=1 Tax=Corynebacterium marquesiae TaxID=2913503 RepID=UPI0038CFD2F7
MSEDELKTAIRQLTEEEFNTLTAWLICPERERREHANTQNPHRANRRILRH